MLLAKLHFKLPTGAHLLLMEHQLCQLHFQQFGATESDRRKHKWHVEMTLT